MSEATCINPVCSMPTARGRRRCQACYLWYWRHHTERPVRLAAPLQWRCPQCGDYSGRPIRNLCNPCYQYQWRTGRPRPAQVIALARDRAELGETG